MNYSALNCKGCDEQFTLAQAATFVQGFCRDCTEQRISILMHEKATLAATHIVQVANLEEQLRSERSERDRLKAEVERLRSAQAWRPIETAPKDRTVMLGYDYEGFLFTCSSGYWTEHNGGGWVRGCPFHPTHWMEIPPLPSPPTTEAQG